MKYLFNFIQVRKIYLLGKPNVGKTTLFNRLTGQKAPTANFSGTTVEIKKSLSKSPSGEILEILDLPGMYGEVSQTGEEKNAWKALKEIEREEENIFLQVISPSQWKTSLVLTLELQQKGIFPILFFNTKKTEASLPKEFFTLIEKELSCTVFFADIEEKNFLPFFWQHLAIKKNFSNKIPPKSLSLSSEKYQFLENLFAPFFEKKQRSKNSSLFFDRLFLHSFFGILFFFGVMWIVFQIVFTLGAVPTEWISVGIAWTMESLKTVFGEGFLARLLIDGILKGVGATILFLPNIFLLFFFLAILKESGYLGRVAFLFDRFFQSVGTSGKASVHLLMGFGCNVPSLMALPSFETKKEKVIVGMMTLFMSCGARLPVYTLLISAFLPTSLQGVALWMLYLFGIFIAFATGILVNRFYHPDSPKKSLLFEMPSLVLPSFKKAMRFAVQKGESFFKKVVFFIVPASVVLWFLFSFPLADVEKGGIQHSYGAEISKTIQPIFQPLGFDWHITAAILSGMAAKEVMVATFAQIYDSPEASEEKDIVKTLRVSGSFSLATAFALLFFTLLSTPCIAVLGVLRSELGVKWMILGAVYPFLVGWVTAFLIFHIFSFFP